MSRVSMSRVSVPISGMSKNVPILHHFRDITTFVVYLQKSFSFDSQLKLQVTRAFRLMCKHIVVITCHISRDVGVRKV